MCPLLNSPTNIRLIDPLIGPCLQARRRNVIADRGFVFADHRPVLPLSVKLERPKIASELLRSKSRQLLKKLSFSSCADDLAPDVTLRSLRVVLIAARPVALITNEIVPLLVARVLADVIPPSSRVRRKSLDVRPTATHKEKLSCVWVRKWLIPLYKAVEMRFAILMELSTKSVHCSSSRNCINNALRIEVVWTIGIGEEDIVDGIQFELANHGEKFGGELNTVAPKKKLTRRSL